MITYNSYSKMKGSIGLEKVLDSTLQVPYKSFILVDDSEDETATVVRRWCEKHGKELVVSRSRLYGHRRPTRATARQTAIDIFFESFSDGWLMFVDDDVVLRSGWWKWMIDSRVLENPRVGEVWGINWDCSPEREKFLALFGVNLKDYLIRKFKERGGTHDTLYRKEAIEGVRIPPELHVYEDAFLHFYVTCHGWESVVNPVGVTHYHPMYAYTNIRQEREKAEVAIKAALHYGICEYEHYKIIRESLSHRFKAYLSLLRPVLGFLPMLLVTARIYGFKAGFAEAVKRQYLKLWFRWRILSTSRRLGRIPDVCEAILG